MGYFLIPQLATVLLVYFALGALTAALGDKWGPWVIVIGIALVLLPSAALIILIGWAVVGWGAAIPLLIAGPAFFFGFLICMLRVKRKSK